MEVFQFVKQNNRKIGMHYEEQAVFYLLNEGYQILERNYANRYGEIDIIAKDKNYIIVYIEVKYRKNNKYGTPFEAITYRKRKQISETSLYHRMKEGYPEDMPCRFDVIGIFGDGSIVHIKNAFDFT